MKSDFSFLAFIKKQDKGFIALIIGAIVIALLLIPLGNKRSEEPIEADDAARLEELCSQIEGVGECRVMVTYKNSEVYGVAVICRGADNPKVRERIVELVTSVYGIGSNRVTVQPMSR